MYREQMAGPRSANFLTHMQVDKVSVDFNRIVSVRDLHFQVERVELGTFGSLYMIIS